MNHQTTLRRIAFLERLVNREQKQLDILEKLVHDTDDLLAEDQQDRVSQED